MNMETGFGTTLNRALTTCRNALKSVDIKEDFITLPLHIYSRPFKGFGEIKYYGRGRVYFAVTVILLQIIAAVIKFFYTGFIISGYTGKGFFYFNFLDMLVSTAAPALLFVVANWSVTAVFDGTGKAKDIFKVYAYAIYPQFFLTLFATFASNYITIETKLFSTVWISIGTVLFYLYLFVGLIVIHEYTFFKTIMMALGTVLAMGIIVFVLALLMTLANEVWSFVYTIYAEAALRF